MKNNKGLKIIYTRIITLLDITFSNGKMVNRKSNVKEEMYSVFYILTIFIVIQ